MPPHLRFREQQASDAVGGGRLPPRAGVERGTCVQWDHSALAEIVDDDGELSLGLVLAVADEACGRGQSVGIVGLAGGQRSESPSSSVR